MSDIDRDAAVRDALLQLACIAHRREPTPDMEFAAQQLPDLILRALGIDVPDGNAEWLLNGDQLARVHTNLRAAGPWWNDRQGAGVSTTLPELLRRKAAAERECEQLRAENEMLKRLLWQVGDWAVDPTDNPYMRLHQIAGLVIESGLLGSGNKEQA